MSKEQNPAPAAVQPPNTYSVKRIAESLVRLDHASSEAVVKKAAGNADFISHNEMTEVLKAFKVTDKYGDFAREAGVGGAVPKRVNHESFADEARASARENSSHLDREITRRNTPDSSSHGR